MLYFGCMGKKGFTLIEIIVSMMIMAVLAVGFYSYSGYADNFFNRASLKLFAAYIGMEAMERFGWPKEELTPTAGPISWPTMTESYIHMHNYVRTYEITKNSTEDYYVITSRITWDD